MAEAATRPARRRTTTPAKSTPAKAAPAASEKVPLAESTPPAAATEVTRFKLELEHAGTTKTYEKFTVPDAYKGTVVGSIYAPIGTQRVGIVVINADDKAE